MLKFTIRFIFFESDNLKMVTLRTGFRANSSLNALNAMRRSFDAVEILSKYSQQNGAYFYAQVEEM